MDRKILDEKVVKIGKKNYGLVIVTNDIYISIDSFKSRKIAQSKIELLVATLGLER